MPNVNIGTAVPEGAKAETLKGRFRFSMWAFDVQEFSQKHHSLSLRIFQAHANCGQAYQACILMRWCWNQIRPAFTDKTAKKYDKVYSELMGWAKNELDSFEAAKIRAPYERITAAPTNNLVNTIWNAYGHLKYLTDTSGYGNRLQKSYDYETSNANVLG